MNNSAATLKIAHKLFTPIKVGDITLQHRVVLAPLTRMRAGDNEVPRDISVEYYRQRSSYPGTLLISEATQISRSGQGYPHTPGIFTREQAAGWKPIVDAVHENKSFLFAQLWHVGRVSHNSYQENNRPPVSSSAVPANGRSVTADGQSVESVIPRALEIDEIKQIVQDYKHAAQTAKDAGFDGVEIHAANGYLIDQFLEDGVNKRTDEYGGSFENRCRFLMEIIEAINEVYPSGRIGVRLSPWTTFGSMSESNTVGLFSHVIQQLDTKNLAYLHLIEPRVAGSGDSTGVFEENQASKTFRKYYSGVLIGAGGYNRESAVDAVEQGLVDMIAFGRYFISNPDLPKRLEENLPLTPYNRATFYAYGEEGYVDYPFYGQVEPEQ